MGILKKIGMCLIVAIFAIGCISDIAWLILYATGQRNFKVVETVNLSEIKTTDGITAPIFKMKYHSNKNGNGVEMFELMFTGYTGVDKAETYSYGVQFVQPSFAIKANLDSSNVYNKTTKYVEDNSDCTSYYDYSNGIAFSSGEKLPDDAAFLVETSSEDCFMLTFKNSTKTYQQKVSFLWMSWDGPSQWTKYDHLMLANDFYDKVKSFSAGYGIFNATNAFDVSNFFDISKMDENGKFYPIEIDSELQEIRKYCTVELEIVKDGAVVSTDSMFGLINGKIDFDCSEPLSSSDYFSDNQFYSLNETHFDYFLQYNGLHKAVIKQSVVEMLDSLNISTVRVNLDSEFLKNNEINLNIEYGCYYSTAPENVDIGAYELIDFVSLVYATPLSEVA